MTRMTHERRKQAEHDVRQVLTVLTGLDLVGANGLIQRSIASCIRLLRGVLASLEGIP